MKLQEYASDKFVSDFSKLSVKNEDRKTVVFGGYKWENCEDDLMHIAPSNRKYFCLCLFVMVSTDQTMYTHFNEYYAIFRNRSQYPKFGNKGFGINFEKPSFLFTKPEELGVDFSEITDEELNEMVLGQLDNARKLIPRHINVKNFFEAMLNDKDFESESAIFSRLSLAMLNNLETTSKL